MGWNNPTDVIAQLQVQLAGESDWALYLNGTGNAQQNIHYPSANPGGIDGSTPDAIPLIALGASSSTPEVYAVGVLPLRNEVLELDFYFPVSGAFALAAGQAEALVRKIVNGLMTQQPSGTPAGLIPFKGGAEISEASEPSAAAIAADGTPNPTAYRHVRARLPYGLHS
jgi:hypothetical protein